MTSHSRALLIILAMGLLSSPLGAAAPDSTPQGAVLRLAPKGEPGDRLIVTGQIVETNGRPVPGAALYVYHADAMGHYSKPGASNPRLSGTVRTGTNGSFRIETVVPSQIGNHEGGPPHIHGMASAPGRANAGFVVNITLAPGRYADAYLRAWMGRRRSMSRTIYQDSLGTWHLVYDPVLP